jgi:hypothetical protein
LAFSGVLALSGLLVYAEIRHVRWFLGKEAGANAEIEFKIGDALFKQQGTEKAGPHFNEAVRLAEQACRLTDYRDPQQYSVLVVAYDAAGSSDKAMEMATLGRDHALATGQNSLADMFQGQMDQIAARTGERK